MIEHQDLSLIRYLDPERYTLQRSDGQELATLSLEMPGDASVARKTVHLAVGRINRRLAIKATSDGHEVGSIGMSWMPGHYRIQIGDSHLRAARGWQRGGWRIYRDGQRIGLLDLSPTFDLNISGPSKVDAGRVISAVLDPDVALALVLVIEMIGFDRLVVPVVG